MFAKFGKLAVFFIALSVLTGAFLVFNQQVNYGKGGGDSRKFVIDKGEDFMAVGERLEQDGLIAGDKYFSFYFMTHGGYRDIRAGEYSLNGQLTIPEIAEIITRKNAGAIQVRITFPEGWTMRQMAARLTENKLPGEEFLALAQNPTAEIRARFPFLDRLPSGTSLEGYLFPDTYDFYPETTAEGVMNKQLQTFESKIYARFAADIESSGHSLPELVTMASIIEGEVRTPEDRKIVSGLFWNRIENNHALQSCATIAYVLGEKKKQYSFEDTRTPSPYNTYLNPGLVPGPISNPGVDAFEAALHPAKTDYVYFLTDPATGKTIFSRTIDEHNANKARYGL